jgi:hypothetical protein
MKRRHHHGVFFVDDARHAVAYDGPRKARAYLRKLKATLPLDTHFCEALSDFAQHRLHLTRFCVDIFQGQIDFAVGHRDADRAEGREPLPMSLDQVFAYTWDLYVVAHRRANALMGEGVAEASRAAWALFMYFYRYMRGNSHEALQALRQEATRFDYVAYCEADGAQVAVSTDRIGDYSLHVHWQAATAVVPTFYELPYSQAMYDYLHVLLLRHAQILAGGEGGLSEPTDELFDSPLYCDRAMGRPFFADPAHPARFINDLYLMHTEILLGPQMVRMHRVRWLLSRAEQARLALDTTATTRERASILAAFINRIAMDDVLRRFVVDPMREKMLRTHLMHGEKTRFMRLHPKQEAEPDNVLATLRHNDYSETPELFAKPVGDLAAAFAEAITADVALRPHGARPRPAHEREVLLAIYITLNTWMIYRGAPRTFVESRVHLEEMHVGFDELADPFQLPPERPALVRVMRWHFVLDVRDAVVYAGTNLAAALGAWLTQVRDEAARRLELKPDIIHELLAPLLAAAAASTSTPATPVAAARDTSMGKGVSLVNF